ncbi:MAG: adenylosuccinate lyase [Candidatus Wallbacteria bacterium]|nr:adenylosuccinate lyase [Candidatus Wallbacteria bacterium]
MIDRYSPPEMRAVFSDQARFQAWLKVELAWTQALCETGRAPADCLEEIRSKAVIRPDRILEIEKRTNHDVIAFLESLGEEIGPSARFLHLGLTSSDIVDTALVLQITQALDLICDRLDHVTLATKRLSLKYKDLPAIGRTHGIHAEPITIGLKFLLYYHELRRHSERISQIRPRLGVGKLSGAVGTYSQSDPALEQRALSLLGLSPCPLTTQVIQRDRIADYFYILALIGATLEKIATEIRHLQRSELREMEEPFGRGQKGSSAMPHKRNPIICERICGISRLLRSYLAPALENIPLWHERDISHSSVERVIIPDASCLAYYGLSLMQGVLEDLSVNEDRVDLDLHLLGDAFFSQRLLLFLVEQRSMSREEAYPLVQEVTHRLYKESIGFSQAVREHGKISSLISEAELSEITDLAHYLRHIDTIYARAFD